jgi:hypothetical protein
MKWIQGINTSGCGIGRVARSVADPNVWEAFALTGFTPLFLGVRNTEEEARGLVNTEWKKMVCELRYRITQEEEL